MNSDTDALAAYFEAWREGWPVPAGWSHAPGPEPDGHLTMRGYYFGWATNDDDGFVLTTPEYPSDADIQALTGVLVVELARRGYSFGIDECGEFCVSGPNGNVASMEEALCALVAAWLEVNK